MDENRAATGETTWVPEVHEGPLAAPQGDVVFERAMPSDEALIPALVVRACEFLRGEGLLVEPGEEARTAVGLEEALRNAVVHGNQREFARKVELQVFIGDRHWGWVVRDEGEGFDLAAAGADGDSDSVWAEKGRGLQIMRHFVEQLEYYDNGSTVVGTKRL